MRPHPPSPRRAYALATRAASLAALLLFAYAAMHDTRADRASRASRRAGPGGGAPGTGGGDQWFCHGAACPGYAVTASTPAYETRLYEPAAYAVATVNASTPELAAARGLVPLYQYAAGGNDARAPVLTGTPVTVTFHAAPDYASTSGVYEVAIYLPPQPDGKPAPAPVPEVDVAVVASPARTVYVNQFGGFAHGSVAMANAARMALALTQAGAPFDAGGDFALALYDGPRRLLARHNEVWLYGPAVNETRAVELAA